MKNVMTVHELCTGSTPVHRISLKLAEIKDLQDSGKKTTLYHPSPSRHVTSLGDIYTVLNFVDETTLEALVIADDELVFSHFFEARGTDYPGFQTTYKPGDWENGLDDIIDSYHSGGSGLIRAGLSVLRGIGSFTKGALNGAIRGRAA